MRSVSEALKKSPVLRKFRVRGKMRTENDLKFFENEERVALPLASYYTRGSL